MKTLFLILSTFALISCNKTNNAMSEAIKPLKAVPEFVVNGRNITLTADKSEGDVCSYGFDMAAGSPDGAHITFSPNSSVWGDKKDDKYVPGTLKFIPITATVDKPGDYNFSMEVLDRDRKSNWAYFKVTIK